MLTTRLGFQLDVPLRDPKPVNPMKERVIDIRPAEIVSDKMQQTCSLFPVPTAIIRACPHRHKESPGYAPHWGQLSS